MTLWMNDKKIKKYLNKNHVDIFILSYNII